jgi:uncharacterized protein DUF707
LPSGFPGIYGRPRPASGRRVLVIARVGDDSRHPGWLEGAPPKSRIWDLHLSYFGDRTNPYADRPDDVTLSFEKGTKAIGSVACLNKLGYRIAAYDWVWIPDDDLRTDLSNLNRFFAVVSEYRLDLAQPALEAGSYASHDITLRRPHMRLRYTTFVEIMAACFSRRALNLCRPYFDATVSSWGPDFLFPKLLEYSRRKIAIVDETPVIHTRPAGKGPNLRLARDSGHPPMQEYRQFMQSYRLKRRFDTWAGVDLAGRLVTDLAEIDRLTVARASQ